MVRTSRSDFVFSRALIDSGRLSDDRAREATSSDSGNWPSAANATTALLILSGASGAAWDVMMAADSKARAVVGG